MPLRLYRLIQIVKHEIKMFLIVAWPQFYVHAHTRLCLQAVVHKYTYKYIFFTKHSIVGTILINSTRTQMSFFFFFKSSLVSNFYPQCVVQTHNFWDQEFHALLKYSIFFLNLISWAKVSLINICIKAPGVVI